MYIKKKQAENIVNCVKKLYLLNGILMVNDEIRIRIQEEEWIRESRSTQICHGSATLETLLLLIGWGVRKGVGHNQFTALLSMHVTKQIPLEFLLFHSVLQIQLGWGWEKVSIRIRNPG
jgi:hypothetical protein